MSIKILTDSGSDISSKNPYGIEVLPLHVFFGEEEFRDGVDLDHEEFYNRLIESDVLPKTSQIPPFEFEEKYEELVANGDEVIVITISSKLSGTYQSACIAADEYEGKVSVVDSENVTIGQQVLVLYAKTLVDAGKSSSEIVKTLEEMKKKVEVVALLDTLEYLKMGGRITPAAAAIGNLLSIKPVISVGEGELVVLGKAHGSKNGNNQLIERIKAVGGIDYAMPICLGYTGLSDKLLQKYIKDSKALWEPCEAELDIVKVGAAIGTHAGPGAIAVAFFGA